MKTNIVIKFAVEGIHDWPGIVENLQLVERVGFLQFPHRHTFTFKAIKSVSHDDRDIEIIDLKRGMIHFLHNQYGKAPSEKIEGYTSHCDFGSMSCEMIAKQMVKMFDLQSCEVLEDNENGAVVENLKPAGLKTLQEYLVDPTRKGKGSNIVFICGPLCSGKSFTAKAMSNHIRSEKDNVPVIEVEISDIVKSIKKATERKDLQGFPELDEQIVKEIDRVADVNITSAIVVSGARQTSILQAFPLASAIWIEVPDIIRKSRYGDSDKDQRQDFETANRRDEELGLTELKQYIFTKI